MKSLQWNDRLSVGIELIDDQHKQWIARLSDLATAVQAHDGATRVPRTLNFLVEYTDKHFATEEAHMTENRYPDIDRHRQEHEGLRVTLKELVRDFEEEGVTPHLADFVNTFMTGWLTEHIRKHDQAFGAFLKQKGIVLRSPPARGKAPRS